MKIEACESTVFEGIRVGECFESNGHYYLKAKLTGLVFYGVRLATGICVTFHHDSFATPVHLKVVSDE